MGLLVLFGKTASSAKDTVKLFGMHLSFAKQHSTPNRVLDDTSRELTCGHTCGMLCHSHMYRTFCDSRGVNSCSKSRSNHLSIHRTGPMRATHAEAQQRSALVGCCTPVTTASCQSVTSAKQKHSVCVAHYSTQCKFTAVCILAYVWPAAGNINTVSRLHHRSAIISQKYSMNGCVHERVDVCSACLQPDGCF